MLADPDVEKRKTAALRIKDCRSFQYIDNSVRTFNLPTLNFEANNYTRLISLENCDITGPLVTKKISDTELDLILKGDDAPLQTIIPLFFLPCHSQTIERVIKEVTIASKEIYGHLS